MLQDIKEKFSKLPDSNKAMIYLMWIYKVGGIISGLFVNIYVFSTYQSVLQVLYYNLLLVTSILLGFSGGGYMMSIYKKDIKNMYYFSYGLFILAFMCLFIFGKSLIGIWLFACINGLGIGSFWCAVHSQEMLHIQDKTRDIYSSIISAGTNIISMIVPLLVAIIFYVASFLENIDGYTVVFFGLPGVYLLSFLFIKQIGSYIPSRITKSDVQNFWNIKKYKFGLAYLFGVGMYQGIGFYLTAIIAIVLLKTEVNVGIFEGLVSLFSTFLVLFLSTKRAAENRIKIMGYLTILLFFNYFLFFCNFTVIGYIIFTFGMIVLGPLYRVSEHVYDLQIIDSIKTVNSDFFPSMILREVLLYFGRLVSILGMIGLSLYSGFEQETLLKIGLVFLPIFMIFAWVSIYFHVKYEKIKNNQDIH